MADGHSVLVSVVRGDLPPTAVEQLGVRLSGGAGSRQLDVPPSLPVVHVTLADLAYGLLAASARGGDASSLWVNVVLMWDNLALDESPQADVFMRALWQLSAGETVDEDALTMARGVAATTA